MKGFIEIKEDSYEDTIEHLHKLKSIACKMIKKLERELIPISIEVTLSQFELEIFLYSSFAAKAKV